MVNMKKKGIPNYQNELRQLYWNKRMQSLGKKAKTLKTKEEVLQECIDELRKEYNIGVVYFDKKFFKGVK